jgi:hypothetical protein
MLVERQAALRQIDELLERRKQSKGYPADVAGLNTLFSAAIKRLAPPGSPYLEMMERSFHPPRRRMGVSDEEQWLEGLEGVLAALRADYEAGRVQNEKQSDIPAFLQINKLLTRFHVVAQQLKKRHAGRDSLRITDEYDVQDLIHALLRIEFDDIRPEEWTPSYAGKCARMDFLLKKQRTVIEVKMTRDKLTDKEIGDELLVDLVRYMNHPDCSTLICFVYDPDQLINNPAGLKHDLEALSAEGLAIVVHFCQH